MLMKQTYTVTYSDGDTWIVRATSPHQALMDANQRNGLAGTKVASVELAPSRELSSNGEV